MAGELGRLPPKSTLVKSCASCYTCDMSVEELALSLPRIEKLRLMEALWSDLSSTPDEIESPQWHESALKETESRLAAGAEDVVDWSEAKRILIGRR